MRRDETRWPLSLGFFGATGDYLADVHVRIVNADGQQVLHSESQGPYMLIKLAPGAYTVHATYDGKKEVRKVVVEGNGHATTNFRFANA
jgi:hypothetical protein